MDNKVIVLIGFSSSGKDSLQSALNKVGYKTAISHTSRPMRECEQQHREYHFIDDYTFQMMDREDEFAGSPRSYNTLVDNIPQTWHYGLSKSELNSNQNMVTILDAQGGIALKKELGDRMIGIYVDVSDSERKSRCIKRGDYNSAEWQRREKDDKLAFGNVKNSDVVDLVVENYDIGKCLGEIYKFIGIKRIDCFMDVDGVILRTLEMMAEYYGRYASVGTLMGKPRVKDITAEDIITWNATETLVGFTSNDIEQIFKSEYFWDNIKQYDGIYDIIKRLHDSGKFNIIFTSIGSTENISYKSAYLMRHFPFLSNQIMLVKNNGCSHGKEIINMSNGCICDDNVNNLFTSNAKYKIHVRFDKGDKEWYQGWDGSTVTNPDELYQELMSVWELENRN